MSIHAKVVQKNVQWASDMITLAMRARQLIDSYDQTAAGTFSTVYALSSDAFNTGVGADIIPNPVDIANDPEEQPTAEEMAAARHARFVTLNGGAIPALITWYETHKAALHAVASQ